MPATIRIELFPHSLPASIAFYTNILAFTVLRHERDDPPNPNEPSTTGYAHLHRDTIQLGLSTKPASSYPPAAQSPTSRSQFRKWPVGVEIVIEVDDVHAELERVKGQGWEVEGELSLQEWGLWDFRIRDPDGYFLRISERGGRDGRKEE